MQKETCSANRQGEFASANARETASALHTEKCVHVQQIVGAVQPCRIHKGRCDHKLLVARCTSRRRKPRQGERKQAQSLLQPLRTSPSTLMVQMGHASRTRSRRREGAIYDTIHTYGLPLVLFLPPPQGQQNRTSGYTEQPNK